MIVHVDEDGCGGHGVCCGLAPEVFELSDDGYAVVRVSEVPTELEPAVRNALLQCPARAISVI